MAHISIKIKGIEQLSAQLDGYVRNLSQNLQSGCNEAVEHIRITANDTIAPIDTGEMVSSSFDRQINVSNGVGAECIYPAPYALFVETIDEKRHGDTYNKYYARQISAGYDHLRKPEEKAHFLEITAREQIPYIEKLLKDKVLKTK